MNALEYKIELLQKGCWNANDIMSYFPDIRSKPTAYKLLNKAIANGGKSRYGEHYAKIESILKERDTTLEEQINIIKGLTNNEEL